MRAYGFSHAVWTLCPEDWKASLGEDWAEILRILILKSSPNSCLARDSAGKREEDFPQVSFSAARERLFRAIARAYDVSEEELAQLKTIYMVWFEGKTAVSRVSDQQKALLARIPVQLES